MAFLTMRSKRQAESDTGRLGARELLWRLRRPFEVGAAVACAKAG